MRHIGFNEQQLNDKCRFLDSTKIVPEVARQSDFYLKLRSVFTNDDAYSIYKGDPKSNKQRKITITRDSALFTKHLLQLEKAHKDIQEVGRRILSNVFVDHLLEGIIKTNKDKKDNSRANKREREAKHHSDEQRRKKKEKKDRLKRQRALEDDEDSDVPLDATSGAPSSV